VFDWGRGEKTLAGDFCFVGFKKGPPPPRIFFKQTKLPKKATPPGVGPGHFSRREKGGGGGPPPAGHSFSQPPRAVTGKKIRASLFFKKTRTGAGETRGAGGLFWGGGAGGGRFTDGPVFLGGERGPPGATHTMKPSAQPVAPVDFPPGREKKKKKLLQEEKTKPKGGKRRGEKNLAPKDFFGPPTSR